MCARGLFSERRGDRTNGSLEPRLADWLSSNMNWLRRRTFDYMLFVVMGQRVL